MILKQIKQLDNLILRNFSINDKEKIIPSPTQMQIMDFLLKNQNKKLMMYENVIGFSSAISFLILIFVTSFLAENNIAKIVLFILAFILLIIGVSVALKIETETGYYECQKCHYKYVPKYSQVYFAMHSGTTRYMKCPKCNKKSWQRKTLSK